MKRGTPRHPKMFALAEALKVPLSQAVGIMEMLWQFTADHCPRGNVGSIPDAAIAQSVAWSKKSTVLIEALCEVGFLERNAAHRLIIHDWPDHAESSVCKKLSRSGKDFLPSYGKTAKQLLDSRDVFVESIEDTSLSDCPSREAEAKAEALGSSQISENSSRARVLFDEFLPRWGRHKGFKKPNKAMQARADQRWAKIDITESELDAAMDGFFQSEWGKREHFPVLGFVKDPHSWIADEVRPPVVPMLDNSEGWDSTPASDAPPRDFVAEWNAVVIAVPAEWHHKRSPIAALRKCEEDPDFCSRFGEVCELAQKAHGYRGSDAAYITFEWIIREKDGMVGWWRLLTALRWMATAKPMNNKSKLEELWDKV